MSDTPAPNDGEPQSLGEYNGHEIYPMPMFVTLAVADVAATAAWYERALGFTTMFRAPDVDGQPPLVHLRRRKYQDVLLTPAQPGAAAGDSPSSLMVSFSADGEVDALAERARSIEPLGRAAVEGPFDTPWNTRDLRVTDPAGHRLVFTGRRLQPDAQLDSRMKTLFEKARGRRGIFLHRAWPDAQSCAKTRGDAYQPARDSTIPERVP